MKIVAKKNESVSAKGAVNQITRCWSQISANYVVLRDAIVPFPCGHGDETGGDRPWTCQRILKDEE